MIWEIAVPIAIIVLLILVNGLFVAAEFALVMAPRPAIEKRAAGGSRRAAALKRVLSDALVQDRTIATAQLGITLASLGLGMYGEHVLAEWIYHGLKWVGAATWVGAHAASTFLSIATLTYFHIVVGEMVPKSLALQRPESSALLLIRPVQWAQLLTFPLVILLAGLGNVTLRLFGVRRQSSGHERSYSPDELQFVVAESQQGGLLRAEAGQVLQDLLEFGEITAGAVMVPRTKAVGLQANASPEEIKRVVRESRHTRYPVYERDLDHIVGVVHLKDLLRVLLAESPLPPEIVRPMPRVPEGLPLDKALESMRSAGVQMAIVMDEHGGTAGIITMEELLEEIVGEIDEPGGLELPPELYLDEKGTLHVPGEVRLPEVGEHLGVDLDHDEVDSVSGLVLLLLGRPATPGDAVEYEGFRFEVTEVAGHGVESCLVTKLPEAAEPEA
ncbi:MAG TPA: hemolysin family protein [Pirellulaceae bacterium]|jgi:CBS domain containing-hemolysin-like protein|nr:hemolysin family protein [Pirellulaceae bacterium]